MNYSVGQKLWARWDSIPEQALVMQVPVKVKSIEDGIITVVEDREENAIDFNKNGTWITSQGQMVRLVERR
mgnify:CR=1 FL=1